MPNIVLTSFMSSSSTLLDRITNYCKKNEEAKLNMFSKITPNLKQMILEDHTIQVGEIGRSQNQITNTDVFFKVTTEVLITSKTNDPIIAMDEINAVSNELIYLINTDSELKKLQFRYISDEYYHTVEEGIKARSITLESQEGYSIDLLPQLLCPDYNLDVELKKKKKR